MAFSYLLDTNILSDLMRHPQGTIAQRIEQVGEESICTSIIVSAELRYGARKKRSHRLQEQVEAILLCLKILPLEAPSDQYYAKLRQQLGRQGTPIGPNDMLIAAQCLTLNLTLITANTREFSRVEGLKWENWLTT